MGRAGFLITTMAAVIDCTGGLFLSTSNDTMTGTAGFDDMRGRDGADRMSARAGNDRLSGSGNDANNGLLGNGDDDYTARTSSRSLRASKE